MHHNVDVYEMWRVSALTIPNKNWLWKIRRIFQVRTDQAIAYILCCVLPFFIHLVQYELIRDLNLVFHFANGLLIYEQYRVQLLQKFHH